MKNKPAGKKPNLGIKVDLSDTPMGAAYEKAEKKLNKKSNKKKGY